MTSFRLTTAPPSSARGTRTNNRLGATAQWLPLYAGEHWASDNTDNYMALTCRSPSTNSSSWSREFQVVVGDTTKVYEWISPPVTEAVTISGPIDVTLEVYDSSVTGKISCGILIQRLDSEGNIVSQIADSNFQLNVLDNVPNWTISSPTSTTLAKGDRIRFVPYARNSISATTPANSDAILYPQNINLITFTETIKTSDMFWSEANAESELYQSRHHNDMAYSPTLGMYAICGYQIYTDQAYIKISYDGTNYTDVYVGGIGTNLQSIEWSSTHGRFIAVGENGQISWSSNGTTWTHFTSPTTNSLQKIRYSEIAGAWIIVGLGGVVLRSTGNGSQGTWTLNTTTFSVSGVGINLYEIACSTLASNILIFGNDGYWGKSTNGGSSWTRVQTTDTSLLFRAATYSQTRQTFYASGGLSGFVARIAESALSGSTNMTVISNDAANRTPYSMGEKDGVLYCGATWKYNASPVPSTSWCAIGVSYDSGSTWSWYPQIGVNVIRFIKYINGYFWAAGAYGFLRKSANGLYGTNYTQRAYLTSDVSTDALGQKLLWSDSENNPTPASSTLAVSSLTLTLNPISITDFYTQRLNSSILSGIAFANIWARNNYTSDNKAALRVEIAVTDESGGNAVVWGSSATMVGGKFNHGGILNSSTAYGPNYCSISGPDMTINDGYRIRVRIYATHGYLFTAVTGSYTYGITYGASTTGASADSYIDLPVAAISPRWISPAQGSQVASNADLIFESLRRNVDTTFQVNIDSSPTFSSPKTYQSDSSNDAFEYLDNGNWTSVPTTGLPSDKSGALIKTQQSLNQGVTLYARVRQSKSK